MKAKSLLMLCALMCISFTQINAQDNSKAAVQGWIEGTYWSPVFCGSEMVGLLQGGAIRVHFVYRFKDGNFYKEIDQIKGEVTSDKTGEAFQIKEIDKTYKEDVWYITWHYNLIGNQGSHYIGTLTYNYSNGAITVENTICK
nr:hypothetical protein [uncultured Carboxylicivirga sp.]